MEPLGDLIGDLGSDVRLDGAALIAEGRRLAQTVSVGRCPFLDHYGVASESEFKRRAMADGTVMLHAQIGFRDPEKSRRAWAEIHGKLDQAGYAIHRYGICLDWSMGYPAAARGRLGRGTGLILDRPQDFADLTAMAPVAPHFGDFVIGLPAALENTQAALAAGATIIGNLGQYFTFRMPGWTDDVGTTAETVRAIALMGAQAVECLVHSNLDDGFAALFTDLACSLGAALIERHIVEDLIGARVTHCYGNTFSDGPKRLAFLLALAEISNNPGSMVYGNTTRYGGEPAENWANLAAYFMVDIAGQRICPTGHALNPVPITEAQRIPDIDEVVDVHLAANRLIARADDLLAMIDAEPAQRLAAEIVAGGRRFRDTVLRNLADAGVDTGNPAALLLALRRVGAKRLEEMFGPGQADPSAMRGRRPVVASPSLSDIGNDARRRAALLDQPERDALAASGLRGLVVSTDVHEYGKILIDNVLSELGLETIDGGVHGETAQVVSRARERRADFIAISTYNGVALDYLNTLTTALADAGLDLPIFIGGKLNQVPNGSNTSLPVNVTDRLKEAGAIVCVRPEDMLEHLIALARSR